MRKYIVLLFTLLLQFQYCYGQSGWVWQNPLPQGNDLYCVRYVNNNTAFACGSCGTIMKTTDSGLDWDILRIDSGYIYSSLYFNNLSTGWVIGSQNLNYLVNSAGSRVMKTTDSGNNWIEKFYLSGSCLLTILFTSIDTGYITGLNGQYGNLYKTVDGGDNWDQISLFSYPVRSIFFSNNTTGYIFGPLGIAKTTNGGSNWNNQYQLGGYGSINSIEFIDSNTGIAAGLLSTPYSSSGVILLTNNGGNSWSSSSIGSDPLFDLKFVNNNTGYVCGTNTLKRSINGGNNWSNISLNESVNYNSIEFFNNNGLIAGSVGVILRTSTNGENWQNDFSGFRSISNVYSLRFVNKLMGFAVCERKVLKTTNAGLNWLVLSTPASTYLNTLCVIDTNTIYVGGGLSENSTMMKSSDGGSSWIVQNPFIGHFLNSVYFVNAETGYCCGSDAISKTTDGGNNWVGAPINGFLKSIFFTDHNTGFVVGYQNGYKTTDGGSNWIALPQSAMNLVTSVYFINASTGFTTNYNMQIRKTTNGGNTWSIKTSGESYYLEALQFFNSMTGYAVGDYGVILKTTNSGDNWFKLNSPTNNEFCSVFPVDSNECYVTGQNSTILKTTNGGWPIGFVQQSEDIPSYFNLSQNYLNPFNPQTKIMFDVSKIAFTKLIVYDILGREVATLVNEELKPGTYSFYWDGSNYASGIYFYSLVSGDYAETKKMVLMK